MSEKPVARSPEHQETADADKVDLALEALVAEDVRTAEDLLLEVMRNCPERYAYRTEVDGGLVIKFWDQREFFHYVTFGKARGEEKAVRWMKSAYPRAFYYLGFLKTKLGDPEQALAFLDAGLALEPTNAKLVCEKAQALISLKRHEEALALYRTLKEPGPHVSAHDVAMGLRGQGSILVDLGDLHRAREAFERSLEIEPGSEVALGELDYIAHLLRGGKPFEGSVTTVTPSPKLECASCGKPLSGSGKIANVDGRTVALCQACDEPKKPR
ncbi:MAG TPA: tetratricopeptide repeat protein [Myxococcales bacterium]